MRSLLIIFLLSTSFSALAAPDNSNGEKFEALEQQIQNILRSLESLNIENALLKDAVEDLEADLAESNADLSSLEDKLFELSGNGGNDESAEFVFVGLTEETFVFPPTNITDFLVDACQRIYGESSRLATSREVAESTVNSLDQNGFFVRVQIETQNWSGTGSSVGRPTTTAYDANLLGATFNATNAPASPVAITNGLKIMRWFSDTGFQYTDAYRAGCSARMNK